MSRLAFVTGATGYVGGRLTQKLLEEGWRVRVLSRSRDKAESQPWGEAVEIVEGDIDAEVLADGLKDVDVAWYLVHAMGDADDFVEADREMAETFSEAALAAGVDRIVYLGGLHPDGEALSPHLASRVEVGEILMASGVPTAALQAGVVLGDGSASFEMLRHLSERLPMSVGPQWLRNQIQPIAVDDVLHYLVRAADLPASINRTFDVGGPDVVEYAQMLDRYAQVVRQGRRPVITLPVMTPDLAARWIGLITPISADLAKPLVGSLQHDTVVSEHDLDALVGPPPGGAAGFEESVRRAVRTVDPTRWLRVAGATAATAAALGALAASRHPGGTTSRLIGAFAWVDAAGITALSIADDGEHDDTPSQATKAGLAVAGGLAEALLGDPRDRSTPARTVLSAVMLGTAAELARRVAAHDNVERLVALTPWLVWRAARLVR